VRRQVVGVEPHGLAVAGPVCVELLTDEESRVTHGIDGSETYDVTGERQPGARLKLTIRRNNGEASEVSVICRLDSDEEVSIYEAGGMLQRFAQDFLDATKES
jgi:aconitate hydratase